MSAAPAPRNRGAGGDALAPAGPNLARRPFVNRRPVARAAVLLLVAGAVLLLVDLWLYVGYARARQANASQLREIESRIETERRDLAAAEAVLQEADVDLQNDVVEFINQRLAERSFGWSVLFDRLADLLPQDVRLLNLGPRFIAAEERRGDDEAGSRRVELSIQGLARDGEAILQLVDALFADPAFESPNLSQENRQQGEVRFSLSVVYLPDEAEALARPAPVMSDPDAEADTGAGTEARTEAGPGTGTGTRVATAGDEAGGEA